MNPPHNTPPPGKGHYHHHRLKIYLQNGTVLPIREDGLYVKDLKRQLTTQWGRFGLESDLPDPTTSSCSFKFISKGRILQDDERLSTETCLAAPDSALILHLSISDWASTAGRPHHHRRPSMDEMNPCISM